MDEDRGTQLRIVSLLEGLLGALAEIAKEDIKIRGLIRDWDKVVQWRVINCGNPLLMIVKDQAIFIQPGMDRDPDLSITLNSEEAVLQWLSGDKDIWDQAIEKRSIEAKGDWWDIARLGEVVRLARERPAASCEALTGHPHY